MAILNRVAALATQAGDALETALRVVDVEVLGMQPDLDRLPDQSAVYGPSHGD